MPYKPIERVDRFPLPDDWNPATDWQVQLGIPGDPEYLAIIAGLVADLTFSANHERDTTRTGAALVSRRWQAALDRWPIGIVPPCDVPSPPYDTPDPAGRTPAEQTIDDLLWWLWVIVSQIDDDLNDAIPTDVIIQTVINNVVTVVDPQADIETPVSTLVETMATKTPAERAAKIDADLWKEPRCHVVTTVPDMPDQPGSFYDWLNDAAENLFTWLDGSADWLFDALSGTVGLLTGSAPDRAIDQADQGGAGFGYVADDCPPATWSHTYDFKVEAGPFVPVKPLSFAQWAITARTAGVGYTSTYYSDGGGYMGHKLALRFTGVQPFKLNSVKCWITYTGTNQYDWQLVERLNEFGGYVRLGTNENVVGGPGSYTSTIVLSGALATWFNIDLHMATTTNYKLTQVQVNGEGYDPFI